ncbi:MAG TPA: hypothetical protein GX505_04875 [Clostridiales bacterium]|nr:hypothetical protein [Clostridiales bacterium]
MAVINITPFTDITELIASDRVNAGDVLLLEEGIYFQNVIITKDNIRIIAKGPGVIFDGQSSLITAFTLSNVTGVVIEGVNIRHYRFDGIVIDGGSGNRIIKNRINNLLTIGISVFHSSGNLIWKNEVCRCNDGIVLNLTSTSNRIIDNIVKDCSGTGFGTVLASDSNNAFVSNKAIRNRLIGFDIFGNNNLVYDNLAIDNNEGIRTGDGSNTLIIGNVVKGCTLNGYFITDGIRNQFSGENHIACNRIAGILDQGELGVFYKNEISFNGDTGITLFFFNNLVMDNILVCNVPENIIERGSGNIFINNIQKPCEPCEAPGVICGDCDKEDNSSN